MNELWVIIALVFTVTLLGVQAIYGPIARWRQATSSTNRRLEQSADQAGRGELVNALRNQRRLTTEFDNPILRSIDDAVTQTGLRLNRNLLAFSAIALIAILFFAWGSIFGRGAVSLLLAIGSTLFVAFAFVSTVRQRRIARFAELLPDSIDVIVRAVRVGYPLPAALALVAREMPAPVGPEFGMTAEEISFGQDIRTAVEGLYRRVGLDDLVFLVVAINVQTQTGGNLAEILSRLSRLLRNRAKLQLKIRALSADGRISALVLSLMPFILLGGITLIAPSYFSEVRHHPFVVPAMIYGIVSLVAGNIIMYRMVNFRF
ncbi:MAG: type secretion system protein [Bryobacterales bacterium]|nr:type secretion system protein [Bryobacterales bacterium]